MVRLVSKLIKNVMFVQIRFREGVSAELYYYTGETNNYRFAPCGLLFVDISEILNLPSFLLFLEPTCFVNYSMYPIK